MPHSADVLRHALAVRGALAVPPEFPARGRAWPSSHATPSLRKAGWPVTLIEALTPQYEHRGPRAGQRTGDALQEINVVPLTWLTELARRLGCDLADICRGTVPDESC